MTRHDFYILTRYEVATDTYISYIKTFNSNDLNLIWTETDPDYLADMSNNLLDEFGGGINHIVYLDNKLYVGGHYRY